SRWRDRLEFRGSRLRGCGNSGRPFKGVVHQDSCTAFEGGYLTMTSVRFIATTVALSIVLLGPIHAVAETQQLAPTPEMDSSETQGTVPSTGQHRVDRYDVGAAAANVLWIPVKAAVCGISAGAGAMAFVLSLGALRGWTESAFSEGCIQKWLLSGNDFRPLPSPPHQP